MVNLLVVALLLVPSNAHHVGIGPFKFLCKAHAGGYYSFRNSTGIMRVNVGNGNGRDIGGFRTEADGTIAAQSHNIMDDSYGRNEHVELWLKVDCAFYRKYCPAIENMCQFTTQSHLTLVTPYTGHEDFYNGGAFAVITPRNQKLVKDMAELSYEKMTLAEVCEPPYGPSQVMECHYKQLEKRSSNIDNGAATADFNKGRPARLSKGLF